MTCKTEQEKLSSLIAFVQDIGYVVTAYKNGDLSDIRFIDSIVNLTIPKIRLNELWNIANVEDVLHDFGDSNIIDFRIVEKWDIQMVLVVIETNKKDASFEVWKIENNLNSNALSGAASVTYFCSLRKAFSHVRELFDKF